MTLIRTSLIDLFGIRSGSRLRRDHAGATFTGNYFGVAGALESAASGRTTSSVASGASRTAATSHRRRGQRNISRWSRAAPDHLWRRQGGGVLNFFPKSSKSKKAARYLRADGGGQPDYGTYDKRLASAEFGAPFSIAGKESGVYIYAQHEDSLHYYNNIYNQGTLLQVSFNTELSNTVRLEYGGMYQHANLNQSLGWNRVTQKLIDSDGKKYLGGQPALYLDTNRRRLPAALRGRQVQPRAVRLRQPVPLRRADRQSAGRLRAQPVDRRLSPDQPPHRPGRENRFLQVRRIHRLLRHHLCAQ